MFLLPNAKVITVNPPLVNSKVCLQVLRSTMIKVWK